MNRSQSGLVLTEYHILVCGNLFPVEYSTENTQHIQNKKRVASLTNKQAKIPFRNQTKQNMDKSYQIA